MFEKKSVEIQNRFVESDFVSSQLFDLKNKIEKLFIISIDESKVESVKFILEEYYDDVSRNIRNEHKTLSNLKDKRTNYF